MLIWLVCFFGIAAVAAIWNEYSREKRERNKELKRIEKRLTELDSTENDQDEAEVKIILWGEVIDVLESVHDFARKSKGILGLQILAQKAEDGKLIIKKRGEELKIETIAQLQSLIDTYNSDIQLKNFLDEVIQHDSIGMQAYVPENIELNSTQEAYLAFANIVSHNNHKVSSEISLFFEKKDQYFNTYYFDLVQRGIEKPSEIQDVIVLIDALVRQKKITYQNPQSELYHVLDQLDDISSNILSSQACYQDLQEQAKISLVKMNILEEEQVDSLFGCVISAGYRLIRIKDETDNYILFLMLESNIDSLLKIAEAAEIKLYFVDRV